MTTPRGSALGNSSPSQHLAGLPLPLPRGRSWLLRTATQPGEPAARRRRSGTRDAGQVRRPRAVVRHAGGWVDVTPARAR